MEKWLLEYRLFGIIPGLIRRVSGYPVNFRYEPIAILFQIAQEISLILYLKVFKARECEKTIHRSGEYFQLLMHFNQDPNTLVK
ncbi:hypothetical protein [Salegentibacter sp. F14]